ncbi:bifunctional diaminohydroxyphosphoribosylaminopyrimidine deaminase/5-amino-6-(5-phosphoribosylamino)uracil reductase RibD [Paenibacillus thalictri]|uniref:Riboflavin biosynthesis protein RibD n=1 Tax=Paenibacillus thalictri TaxID=2527873 RepID=A0A4Q9DX40_9BACL|nr:bifunctional diaminohydroxyphosphoribosylaminopyrimidine deaminase/5-amino-6-(5-phosphoribosylamino)uracil reductase RibD [Paenibacillus thalictri]TBL79801.1 bifunctional diaminohydroxyphosphoribosylaminopyrimidine deaminase/5-amino-6-(5-phosphoribosylamino)uracil reductase RibD [Paenibacillus thalictri]
MELLNDEYYMNLALQLAEGPAGQTGINPAVGCVVVKDGRIVGMGAHLQRGTPHAEVHALNMAGASAEGSTVYVTLEPCSHHGRTPPCSDRLIHEKVQRVVVACTDPNPLVAGTGIAKLRSHGIEVEVGLLEMRALRLNEMFNKYIATKLPFVTLKTASTLDGKIAAKTGDSKWITGESARAYVHTLRHRHQGIMVGVETVLQDNPQLTTRLPVPALQPIRIVVDSRLRIPLTAQVVTDRTADTIVLTTELADERKSVQLEEAGVSVIRCGAGPQVDLAEAMRLLGEREIGSILLEGGGRLNGAMLTQGLIDKIILFFAPKIIGGADAPGNFRFEGIERMEQAFVLERLELQQFDSDICISGYPRCGNEVPK